MNLNVKLPKSFWVISIVALLWNIMGVIQFFLSTFYLDVMVESLPQEVADLYRGIPTWYTVIFAIAVFTGLLGCISMLLRKRSTVVFFGISLLTVLIAQGYWIFGTGVIDVIGLESVIMPLAVISISIFLYFYSKGATKNGWLN